MLNIGHFPKNRTKISIRILILLLLISFLSQPWIQDSTVTASSFDSSRKVNIPYLGKIPPPDSFTPAIFWFGKVDPTNNYADVRLYYYENYIKIVVHIIDRLLWYDQSLTPTNMAKWDSVSIYMNLSGNSGSNPGPNTYLFQTQLYSNLQASYKGNDSGYIPVDIPFTSYTEWRGSGVNNNLESAGWVCYFTIPFTNLGVSSPPPEGTKWGLGVVVHDRDDSAGLSNRDTIWPETMNPNTPSTWGQLSFGWPGYTPISAIPINTIKIRQGLNGATVVDGAVGGHTICGNDGVDKWTNWGNFNYAGYNQMNVQNQWDVSDWPCFSKFYITFPLNVVPPGQTIVSAALTMSLFGTAGGGQWGPPPDSYIEVLTIDKDWDESTLTWNNAPLADENISGAWVPPVPGDYQWDVSKAVINALNSGLPLRLVIYSIDGERHSGKYFYTSDSNDWNGEVRPTLRITYGTLCDSPGITCHKTYIPLAKH